MIKYFGSVWLEKYLRWLKLLLDLLFEIGSRKTKFGWIKMVYHIFLSEMWIWSKTEKKL